MKYIFTDAHLSTRFTHASWAHSYDEKYYSLISTLCVQKKKRRRGATGMELEGARVFLVTTTMISSRFVQSVSATATDYSPILHTSLARLIL